MNIGICAANEVGFELLNFILNIKKFKAFKIPYVITADLPYKDRIERVCSSNGINFKGELSVNSDEFIKLNKENNIDLVLLLWFPTIVKKKSIQSVNIGFINLHPSMIPWNRGMHPYYWSFIDDTPVGTTIHFINENIDEGEILFQSEIKTDWTDTGGSVYQKNLLNTINLFKTNFEKILTSNYKTKLVDNTKGTFHLKKELDNHSCLDLDKKYTTRDLLNRIRGRTFGDKGGTFFYDKGKKYFVSINIEAENE
tara:strand:+ start:38 stop:799 length:762 start_codon:yes stop_codon:yes gene_type:complete